jgi:hypothetical protein
VNVENLLRCGVDPGSDITDVCYGNGNSGGGGGGRDDREEREDKKKKEGEGS